MVGDRIGGGHRLSSSAPRTTASTQEAASDASTNLTTSRATTRDALARHVVLDHHLHAEVRVIDSTSAVRIISGALPNCPIHASYVGVVGAINEIIETTTRSTAEQRDRGHPLRPQWPTPSPVTQAADAAQRRASSMSTSCRVGGEIRVSSEDNGERQHGDPEARSCDSSNPQPKSQARSRCRCRNGRTAQRSKPTAAVAKQRGEERLRVGERVGTVGGGHQPPGQQQRAEGERYAGEAVGDRQHRGDLRPIDLQVRRERTFRGKAWAFDPFFFGPEDRMWLRPSTLTTRSGAKSTFAAAQHPC